LFALLLITAVHAFAATVSGEDSRVRIVSPVEGQQFAPGDNVPIVVEIAAPLYATDGGVTVAGMGLLRARGYPGRRFTTKLTIPDAYAGPMKLVAYAIAGERIGDQVACRRLPNAEGRSVAKSRSESGLGLRRNR
jgi:hypothetical protein